MMTTAVHRRSSTRDTIGCEALQLPILAPVSTSLSRHFRPGRPQETGREAERGVSDPASRASGSAQARRAGSLTPRVSVQIVRTNAARIASRSAPSFALDRRRHQGHDRAGRLFAIEWPQCRPVPHELMVVLRCTQKLLVRLKQVGDLPFVESTTKLATGTATSSESADVSTCSSSANGLDFRSSFRSARRSVWPRCFPMRCARGCRLSASPVRTSPMNVCGCRTWRSAGPGIAACLAP